MAKLTSSARLDPEVAAFVEEERLKKGLYKSAAHNTLLKELMNLKKRGMKLTDISGESSLMSSIDITKNLEKENSKNEKIFENNEGIKDEPKSANTKVIMSETKQPEFQAAKSSIIPETLHAAKPPEFPAEKLAQKPLILPLVLPHPPESKTPETKTSEAKSPEAKFKIIRSSIPDIKPAIPVMPDVKIENSTKVNITSLNSDFKVEIPKIKENKIDVKKTNPIDNLGDLINLSNIKAPDIDNVNKKPKIKEYRRMGESETVIIPRSTEEEIKRYLDKQQFNKNISEMHTKIQNIDDRVCKDGDCTKRELSELRKDVSGLFGLKTDITKDLSKLNEIDDLKKDLNEIKGKFKRTEICPGCGYTDMPHLSSYCPECGVEIKGWDDAKDWKPYKERNRK